MAFLPPTDVVKDLERRSGAEITRGESMITPSVWREWIQNVSVFEQPAGTQPLYVSSRLIAESFAEVRGPALPFECMRAVNRIRELQLIPVEHTAVELVQRYVSG